MGRQAPIISHLFFTDDSLLFMKVEEQSAQTLQEVLMNYEMVSGQFINVSKSLVYFFWGTTEETTKNVLLSLKMTEACGGGGYLGLPYLIGSSKKEIFSYIKDHMVKKTF